jgi:hypothetical protein
MGRLLSLPPLPETLAALRARLHWPRQLALDEPAPLYVLRKEGAL